MVRHRACCHVSAGRGPLSRTVATATVTGADGRRQEELALPASLQAFQLENSGYITLAAVGSWHQRLRAAVGAALIVRAGNIECKCRRSILDDGDAFRLVSHLPDGFSAMEMRLDMRTPLITVNPQTVMDQTTQAAAAWHLLCFFAMAPASYRRFSVFWTEDLPLKITVCGKPADEPPGMGIHCLEFVAFDTADALAGHMRARAVQHNMSVTVVEEPTKGIILTRL